MEDKRQDLWKYECQDEGETNKDAVEITVGRYF